MPCATRAALVAPEAWGWVFLIWVAVSYVSFLYDENPGGEKLLKIFPVCSFS